MIHALGNHVFPAGSLTLWPPADLKAYKRRSNSLYDNYLRLAGLGITKPITTSILIFSISLIAYPLLIRATLIPYPGEIVDAGATITAGLVYNVETRSKV